MKKLARILAVLTLVLGTFGFLGQQQALALNLGQVTLSTPILGAEYVNPADAKLTTEFGQKIDINNSDIRDFREVPGLYPTLAGLIIQNAPYDSVEAVLDIPGLNEELKSRLQASLDDFVATPVDITYVSGQDRFNAGIY